jgi:hypothetical protein
MSAAGREGMQSDSSNIVVIVTGKQVAKVKIGYGPDAAAFDAERGLECSVLTLMVC